MKRTMLSLLLLILIAGSCTSTKPGYTYTIGSTDSSLFSGSYISYGNDVFEHSFLSRVRSTYTVDYGIEQTSSHKWQDTLGIYYLDGKKRRQVLFQRFNDTAIILGKGPFSAKQNGITLADTPVVPSKKISFSQLKDTTFSGVKLVYSISPVPEADSLTLLMYYLPKRHFMTIYDLIPLQRPDKNHHSIGMDVLLHGEPAAEMHTTLRSFRPLTKAERRTCARLRKRALETL
jgi:hypothetical protein